MQNNILYHLVGILIVSALTFSCTGSTTSLEPEVVDSHCSNLSSAPDGFYAGEWADININVEGNSLTGPEVSAKVDIVFIVDESGSMLNNDPGQIRHSTIKEILTTLDPNQHKAAIVTFNTNVRESSQLTVNFEQLGDYLDALPGPDGYTNISDAMQSANSLLAGSTANHRIGILLTDGYPESENSGGYDIQQDAEINDVHVPYAIAHDINYYVVHLYTRAPHINGTALLKNRISYDTGGEYFLINEASEIAATLPAIVNEASSTLVLKNATLDVEFRMGPNEYSMIDEHELSLYGSNLHQVFPHRVITEERRTLPKNHGIALNIPITSYNPIPAGSPPDVTEALLPCLKTTAVVRYHLGDGEFMENRIPQVTVKWLRTPDVLVLKRLDPGVRRITISVTNFHRDAPITDVRLWETLSNFFEADYSSLQPLPRYITPYFSNNNTLAYLYWELGDIAPLEKKEVSFKFNYCGPISGEVSVNRGKPSSQVYYNNPDNITKIVTAQSNDFNSKWFGDNTIDAAILNVSQEESNAPDLLIYSDHRGGGIPGTDRAIIPIPKTGSIWNDSFIDNGYDEYATSAQFANPEPLDLEAKNKLWIRIDNRGNQQSLSDVKANIYIKNEYCACPTDLDVSNWKYLGSVSFDPIFPEQFYVRGFEWDPEIKLSSAEISEINSIHRAFFKVVVSYSDSELLLNNNISVVMIPVTE